MVRPLDTRNNSSIKLANNGGVVKATTARGAPGPNTVPTDEAVATRVADSDSATARALVLATDTNLNRAADLGSVSNALVVATGNKPAKYGVVIDLGDPGDFDAGMVEGLTVALCHENGRLAGVYTAYTDDDPTVASVGLAWSDDGLAWVKAGQVFDGSGVDGDPDESGTTGPLLVWDPDTSLWNLFYIGLTEPDYEGGQKSVCRATTPSLVDPTWTRHGAILEASAATSGVSEWRGAAVWHPNIVRANGRYYCFVNATNSTSEETIGYATTAVGATLAGPWTFADSDSPLIDIRTGDDNAGDPCVTKIVGGWRMDFYRSGDWGAADYYATTTDEDFPLGWVVETDATPDLAATNTRYTIKSGDAGSFDSLYAHKPFILRHGGRLFHYYTAVDTDDRRTIAVAVDPPVRPDLTNALAITGSTIEERVSSILNTLNDMGVPLDLDPIAADTFTRANSSSLGSTETGSFAWSQTGAGFTIASNKLAWDGTGDEAAVITSGLSDRFEVEFTVSTQTGQYPCGIFVKGTTTAFADAIVVYRNQGDDHWYLTDAASHINEPSGGSSDDLANGDVLRVRYIDGAVTLYVNDVAIHTWTGITTHSGGTKQGIAGLNGNAATFDNFSVTAL